MKNSELQEEVFFSTKKLIAIVVVVDLLILVLWLVFSKNYSLHFNIAQISAIESCLVINFLLLVSMTLLSALLIRSNKIYKTENLAKDHAFRVIYQIVRLKFAVSNNDELASLICKELSKDLGGEFWFFLPTRENNTIPSTYYIEKSEQALEDSVSIVITEDDKKVYFLPIIKSHKKVGVLIAKVGPENSFRYLRKILPDQIYVIIDSSDALRKLSKAKINQERERLRALILSSISHDLKTPLSSIIGSLKIFNELSDNNHLDEESGKTLISTALEEAERLTRLISDVLEMTRIESGAIKLQKQFLNLSSIIKRTLKRFEDGLKDFELEVFLTSKIRVNFDQISCEQVVQNLIENAIKYSPKNTTIKIWDDYDDHRYRILIKDDGEGIPEEKLEMIFNKFERFDLEDKVVGSGLGLSIVKALMELNNATIRAENCEPGYGGAIFILEFTDFKYEVDVNS
jgi:two-component system sensor histidine kinase KdpD